MKLPLPKEFYKITDIHYKGKRIRTYSFGIGEKKVFSIPAFPHSGVIYLYFLLKYDLNKVQFITFDLPGWIGRSENIFKDSIYDEKEMLELLNHIIKFYNLKTFSLIGYSFGTSVAAALLGENKYDINKVALISPVLYGKAIKERFKRFAMNFIRFTNSFNFARLYVLSRFYAYKPTLITAGMDAKIIEEYKAMIYSANPKVIFSSLRHLFSSDYSEILKNFPHHKLLVANSKDESKFLRDQAAHIRRIVDVDKTLFLHGAHQDFILKPQADVVKTVMRFLTS
ncbi:alpha/beta hydrolase [Candidatus Dojkabacteria bacterium]|jgi:pimeloyl-ACP methyl ester carboxylesterase|nr:alpha/beta hydrolase [Candidatus Dojkabacteria bacterium]